MGANAGKDAGPMDPAEEIKTASIQTFFARAGTQHTVEKGHLLLKQGYAAKSILPFVR